MVLFSDLSIANIISRRYWVQVEPEHKHVKLICKPENKHHFVLFLSFTHIHVTFTSSARLEVKCRTYDIDVSASSLTGSIGFFMGVSLGKTLQSHSLVLEKYVNSCPDMTEMMLKRHKNTVQSINLTLNVCTMDSICRIQTLKKCKNQNQSLFMVMNQPNNSAKSSPSNKILSLMQTTSIDFND